VISIPFTREFAALSPPEFLYDCLSSSRVELKGLCVGAKWRFGSGGSGDAAFLRERSAVSGFEFVAVDELEVDGAPVSSTRIRRAVSSGDLEGAVKLLGRDYSLYGKVEHGRHVAGPALDHPTANLRVRHGVLPPDGVYAGWAKWDGRRHRAALAIGSSPTFRDRFGTERRVELHLLDFAGDLYGLDLEAELLSWIREERRFENAEALKKQIDLDIKAINLALKGT
jgi:riboflavin kinase/FMN adenylyltransferase